MIKNGEMHRKSLQDGREIYLDGIAVPDATTHPAYRNAIDSVCALYDIQHTNEDLMTFHDGAAGEPTSRIWQLPGNYDELVARRRALVRWAESHAGFMGRTPDHVASCLAGMVMGIDVFEEHDPRRANALREYYRYAAKEDLYLTYVIINPQADRSRSAAQQVDPWLTAGIVEEDSHGLTIRGGKMLGTGAVMANELFVTCIQPLRPEDERYAVSFAIPLDADGLKILSRKSYELSAASRFDNPLASRFDENDALIYFDDVRVPWDRVFVAGDVSMCQRQFHDTPAHVYQNYQAQVRLMVKLRLMAGLAHRIATMNGILAFPQVNETLGQIAAQARMVEALVEAMEVSGRQAGDYFVPDRHTLYAAQVLTQQLYPAIVNAIRDLAGGALIALPSSVADFANPDVARLIERTQQSPCATATEKVAFYKLAWDALGSEFASRHTQYEMFYAGATFVTKSHSFRNYDWTRAERMVDDLMSGCDLDNALEVWRSSGSGDDVSSATGVEG